MMMMMRLGRFHSLTEDEMEMNGGTTEEEKSDCELRVSDALSLKLVFKLKYLFQILLSSLNVTEFSHVG